MSDELDQLRARMETLERENARLKRHLDQVGNVVYIAVEMTDGPLTNRIRTVTKPSYVEKQYFKDGWQVFKANLDSLTLEKIYPRDNDDSNID